MIGMTKAGVNRRKFDLHRYDPVMEHTFGDPAGVGIARIDLRTVRRDRAARAVVRAWRTLAGDGRTLVACSGGADSVALALTLAASAADRVALGHVVHAMRSAEESLADRDMVRSLAGALGVGFDERSIRRESGNAEAGARRGRLESLAEMAREAGCASVATGQHAGDQFETVVMALARGAGPRGAGGMPRSRVIAGGLNLIRPMLGVERADCERICRIAGVEWRHDRTNDDRSRTRAAIRHAVTPAVIAIRPGAVRRAAASAELIADSAGVVEDRVCEVFGDGYSWPRATLAAERRIVAGEGLRLAHARLAGGSGRDRLSQRRLNSVIDAIRDGAMHERVFMWPESVRVDITAGLVKMNRNPEGADA